jgi:aldehyde dehydrogenase (NAD+)
MTTLEEPVATRLSAAHQLHRLCQTLLVEREAVIDILTEISTRRAAEYEYECAVRTLQGADRELAEYDPPQVGTVAVFLPSNVLLYSYVLYALVPTLYADRVVLRPATQIKETAARLHTFLTARHALPVELAEVTQREFVEGTLPQADVVVFTGAYANAEKVRAALRPDQLYFFLGSGINPIVVTQAADVTRAVEGVVDIRLLNSGQDCLGPDAIWVDRRIHEAFLEGLQRRLAGVRYGPCTDPSADYGPIVYPGILRQTADFFCRHQDRIASGGRIDFAGRRIEPTVLVWESHHQMEVVEFFCPVFNVCLYDSEETVAKALNSTSYAERAMGATVYGESPQLVTALARRHSLTVNATLLALDDGNSPLGGRGRMANYVARGRRVHPEPVLLSKGLADHWPRPGAVAVA